MNRMLLAMMCCLLWLTSDLPAQTVVTAQVSPAPPMNMFSYLSTDMLVGVKSIDGTASVLISIYTEEDYATAMASTKLGRSTLASDAAKGDVGIKNAFDAFVSQNELQSSSADRVLLIPPTRTAFGKVDAIGDDYLLIGLDDGVKAEPNATSRRRRIIPKWTIGSIDLDAKPVQFIVNPIAPGRKTAANQ